MDEVLISIKAVSERVRVRLLLLLLDREACVCELMAVFKMAQSKLSHQLIALREAGLLQDERRRKWNYYRVNTKSLNQVNRELILTLSQWLIDDNVVKKDRQALAEVHEQMQICC